MDGEMVSIVTPAYNSQKYIRDCIESVLAQTYTNFELIIVDDCSSDKTSEIVKEFKRKDKRLKFIQLQNNSGPAVSRNKGIEIATGQYLTFLDGDDLWFPEMLQKSIETIKSKDCSFVFSSYKRYDENLEPLLSDFIVPYKVDYSEILKSNSISCLTAFVDIGKLGKEYMPLIRKRQDMGLWLKYLRKTQFAYGIKQPLAIYRIRQGSLSRDKKSLVRYQWQFYRNVEKLGFFTTIYYMAHWAVRGVLKYRG